MSQNISSNIQILNGNELIIQGALEAGFSLYTGYPGSPLADYFNILYDKKNELHEKGIRVAIANSEANAAAMASGAKQAGRDTIIAMKSMGLNVASDALAVGNFATPGPKTKNEFGDELSPAVVVVVGDDPWSLSTSAPIDSRYLFKHLHIPFLSPAGPQELKDCIKIAKDISQRSSLYCGVVLTTYLAEGGGRVVTNDACAVKLEKELIDSSQFDLSQNVMVPPNSLKADHRMALDRFPKLQKILQELDLDTIEQSTHHSDVAFVVSGPEYETLKDVLGQYHLDEKFSLYKVFCPYPLNEVKLIPFLKAHKKIIVVEEKRGFIEEQLAKLCLTEKLDCEIIGKKIGKEEGFPTYGGLNFELISQKLLKIFHYLDLKEKDFYCPTHANPSSNVPLPLRLPTFCPGCPHRETLSILKDLRLKLKQQNIDLISHGDVGCYSLSFLPPFKEMHNLSAMGQGGALGAGMDIFLDQKKNPSVILMGDSTFFHSGLTDISNSVQLGHNITYILLDNDNTAMTGHQMTPRTGESVEGFKRPKQSISSVAKSLGVKKVVEVNPSDRYFYQNLLSELILEEGVKVIVSNKECALTFGAKAKKEERELLKTVGVVGEKSFYQINSFACEDCRECVEMTGCPGLTRAFDAYGPKVAIDPEICVADSYCTKIKACPSFEKVVVENYHPTKYLKLPKNQVEQIGETTPKISLSDIAAGKVWRVVITGVGGSGVTTISNILAHAALKMGGVSGVDFKFVDQKGLAQRNGNVTSHLCLFPNKRSISPITPLQEADLVVSPDLLDGLRLKSWVKKEGEIILGDDLQWPLSVLLENDLISEPLNRDVLLKNAKAHHCHTFALRQIATEKLGKVVYQSTVLIGVLFQRGLLPFSKDDIENAVKAVVPSFEVDANLRAFYWGRKLALGEALVEQPQKQKWVQSLENSCLFGASEILERFNKYCLELQSLLPNTKEETIAQWLHDLLIYDRAQNYLQIKDEITKLVALYPHHSELAVRILIKSYIVKDEVFISHLMISPLRDSGDLVYLKKGPTFYKQFINRPSFTIGTRKIEFDLSPSLWMLKIMRHGRLLRKLMPHWHKKEREIKLSIRQKLLCGSKAEVYSFLKSLDNIKGYREIYYKKAQQYL